MKLTVRVVEESGPDQDPEMGIDRVPGLRDALIEELEAAQERLILEAFGYTAENMLAAAPARVEKVVQGERLE